MVAEQAEESPENCKQKADHLKPLKSKHIHFIIHIIKKAHKLTVFVLFCFVFWITRKLFIIIQIVYLNIRAVMLNWLRFVVLH